MSGLPTAQQFLQGAKSVYHVVSQAVQILKNNGFKHIRETEPMEIEGPCVYTRDATSFIAYIPGTDLSSGFTAVCSHTDSPVLKFCQSGQLQQHGSIYSFPVDPYGGVVMQRWLDRELTAAGRVRYAENGVLKMAVVEKGGFFIPQLAPHMQRGTDTIDWCPKSDKEYMVCCPNFGNRLADKMHVKDFVRVIAGLPDSADIINYSIELSVAQVTTNENVIHSARLDNVISVYASVIGLVNSRRERESTAQTRAVFAFNHEEIGSMTRAGAGSGALRSFWRRLVNGRLGEDALCIAYARSVCCSADGAHAGHPVKGAHSCYDPVPLLGSGVVLKVAEKQTYISEDRVLAAAQLLCAQRGVRAASWAQKSFKGGGSTIGRFCAAENDLVTFDCGVAMLAMHSCVEVADLNDIDAACAFFQAVLEDIQRLYEQADE